MTASASSANATQPDHKPVLLTVVGRQRTGKTTFLNALAETTALRGGKVEVWNTDMLNETNSISRFHPDAQAPAYAGAADQALWLEHQITALLERPRDVLLDIGGGWTAFHEIVTTTSIGRKLKKFGMRLIIAYMFGPDLADVDYLSGLQKSNAFNGNDSILIFNQGLIPPAASIHTAFRETLGSPSVRTAINSGASWAMMPALSNMSKVLDSGLSFASYAEPQMGKPVKGANLFDHLRANRWFHEDFPGFLQKLDPERLPHMPAGLEIMLEDESA
ncbi:hypothetical protein A0U89_15495 (plasmid) [Kozakia baliensis]|uniref:Uncharacterized protein n=2 Tax=Kozakia baliensis TaxID=153496 RepID=A0A1D8UYL3_9PROT|nr:hypothetical protein A0U89_15495 [Kozakia baliensis]GEL65768.1 hypothetical protein KBA01_30540 [Kozakia baliensis]